jgi:hypothetical protein
MTIGTSSGNGSPRRNFWGLRFKSKGNSPKQIFHHPDLISSYADVSPHIPKQAHNPAVHPLLAKPVAREENFVLLPHAADTERKRNPNSPTRSSGEPKERYGPEWDQYLSSYREVCSPSKIDHVLIIVQGRYNMSNPPPPPSNRPPGHLKAPVPLNDKQRVDVCTY